MGISRTEFYARLGLLDDIDPLTDEAYRFEEMQLAGTSDQGAAARDKWHVSFHGSQFPGAAERACPRQLIYRMIDIPRSTGSYMFSNRKLTQIADAGKDIEDRLVMRWHKAGYLLSPPPVDPWGHKQDQLVFEDPEHWLTSTVDAIVVPLHRVRPIVAEVKSKYADVIADMRKLIRGPDEKHVKQIKTQIGLAKEHYERNPPTVKRCHNTGRMAILVAMDEHHAELLCPQHRTADCLEEVELLAPRYGYLYYVSRDNPADTFAFFVDYDAKHMEVGRARLASTREAFLAGVLPQENFVEKRFAHPFGWLWGDEPCKWCDFGAVCRLDNKKAIAQGSPINLVDSYAVDEAKGLRADYELDLVQQAVLERWDESASMIPPNRTTGANPEGDQK
jgi:hypothetical protein